MILALPEPGGIRIRDTTWPRDTTDFIHQIHKPRELLVSAEYRAAKLYGVDSVRMVATLKELRAK